MQSIVVGAVVEKDGKFLLVQEAKSSCYGKWNLPAGHLEPGESIFDGVKREVFEECGCKVELLRIVQIGNFVKSDEAIVTILFSTKLLEDNITFNKEEILDVKWFTYEEIKNMKDEVRAYDWLIDAIEAFINKRGVDFSIVKVVE